MAKKRLNCINCGAPLDIGENKCPYCGTSYFDLSSIDMGADEPFYLKIKCNGNIYTQLVLPTLTTTELTEDCVYGGIGNTIYAPISKSLSISLSFNAIADKDGALCKVEIVDPMESLERWEEMMGAKYAHACGGLT